ncbi:MAG: T9SS type A sorting domain-containing protein, partial [Proteobacteria bacterium]|nr:T9SS type A sorting domain-containing protein [Pseudomonadota bacterium]
GVVGSASLSVGDEQEEFAIIDKSTPRPGTIYDFQVIVSDETDRKPLATGQRNWTNRLEQNIPNPFSPASTWRSTTIRYQLASDQRVTLQVFDVAGRLIRTLVDRQVSVGDHSITWNGTNERGEAVRSGVYFYRLDSPDFSDTKRMVLMR